MKFNEEVFKKVVENIPIPVEMLKNSWTKRAIISGTFLFCIHGLMQEFGDVDIIIEAVDCGYVDDIYDYCEAKGISMEEGDRDDYLSLKIENGGITYNVLFTEDYVYNPILYLDNDKVFALDTIDNALEIKMSIGRLKDQLHLSEMVEFFLNLKN